MNSRHLSRRNFLRSTAGGLALAAAPGLTLASTDGDARFVLVILRGAVDGLALCPPYGDGSYRSVRGELAFDAPGLGGGVLRLDGMFGLHPSLPTAHTAFGRGEATVIHAVASPYRNRSHFDGQDLLESGGVTMAYRDGWLNRALEPLGGGPGGDAAIAMAQTAPLVLRGPNPATSWAPSILSDTDDDTLRRIEALYAEDPFFAERLEQALRSQSIASGMDSPGARQRRGAGALAASLSSAARFLSAPDGPRIAVVEGGGWDTHANQGVATGTLANSLKALDQGLNTLQQELGEHWNRTVVAIVTEFGRTVRPNGTRGTDHGTATAALLAGGAVAGGSVIADWPGLRKRDLYEGRDLKPTADLRSVFKSVLVDHLGVDSAFVEREVFPESGSARLIDGLIRT